MVTGGLYLCETETNGHKEILFNPYLALYSHGVGLLIVLLVISARQSCSPQVRLDYIRFVCFPLHNELHVPPLPCATLVNQSKY